MPKNATMYERWLEKVDLKGKDDCWLWTASIDSDGYGRFQYPTGPPEHGQVHIRAHRWTYHFFVGALQDGMVIMHECDTPACVNPRHLRQDTAIANNDDKVEKGRGAQLWGTPLRRSRQTHCHRGHPFDEANTRMIGNHRRCKACERINARNWYWRQKGVVK